MFSYLKYQNIFEISLRIKTYQIVSDLVFFSKSQVVLKAEGKNPHSTSPLSFCGVNTFLLGFKKVKRGHLNFFK